ncbi:hypothetical protein ACI3LY_001610 [Candidozyma auris]|uniref:WD40 repeat-like protein n=2 Tax=Candidozyma auris TaxID=498019 RepID=A0AB73S555_CANAR|nr:hypothetical protein B9J08_001689 [[Candida] auris]PSK79954.1 hypothetical protein CJJ07_000015 [[Candida] auris]QWW22765.1 hypothetical protein CA7LBN_001512 [[Candida] auris]
MTVELSQEQISMTSEGLGESDAIYEDFSTATNTSHEYELNSSESLTFLYNLLYDDKSTLTKADILSILNSLKERENELSFTFNDLWGYMNVQGVWMPPSLRRKFYTERSRVGRNSWFRNMPSSRQDAIENVNLLSFHTKTEFFKFQTFYGKLKNHITHFQLRNLVTCGENLSNGIFYPSSYYHDGNLHTVSSDNAISHNSPESFHSFFKINRLMPDDDDLSSRAMKLDCLVDSRQLPLSANSRISSCASSNKFLVNGTFEGGYILSDISDPHDTKLLGEYTLTGSADGITNHISISKDDRELLISSNDKTIRVIDLARNIKKSSSKIPLAVNCSANSPTNKNQFFIIGDDSKAYIMDRRILGKDFNPCIVFSGHKDYGFGCDWSPLDENLLLTGNQDGTVRLWDRRNPQENLYCWSSSLGSQASSVSDEFLGGPVRNCKFSYNGTHIVWAESLDHVGIIQFSDLKKDYGDLQSRVQSIDFIGKCIGLNMCPADSGQGEELIIGVNDCPLGGILTYQLEGIDKPLDFDFSF